LVSNTIFHKEFLTIFQKGGIMRLALCEMFMAREAAGETMVKKRKKRSDKGKTRGLGKMVGEKPRNDGGSACSMMRLLVRKGPETTRMIRSSHLKRSRRPPPRQQQTSSCLLPRVMHSSMTVMRIVMITTTIRNAAPYMLNSVLTLLILPVPHLFPVPYSTLSIILYVIPAIYTC
jgi:hypothetical protein